MKIKFGDVVQDVKCNIDRENNPFEFYVAGYHLDSEDLTIRRRGRFSTDDVGPAFVRKFTAGQILYGSRRTYLKKVAVADFDGICANTTFVFESKNPSLFDQRLLPFLMLSDNFTKWSISHSKGSTNPYILFSDLAEFEFDLPSLADQKKLADKLWAAYRLKESYKKLLASMDELVKSRFLEMFGRCSEDKFGWGLKTLEDCCVINPQKTTDSRLKPGLEVSFCPMPYISEKGEIKTDDIIIYDKVKSGFTYFAENDVLFAKITPCMENGKGAIARNLKNGIGFGSTEFHVLRPKKEMITPEWLYFLTTFQQFRKDAENNMTGSAGQRRVPANFLKKYRVSVPPKSLQYEFARILQQLDKSKLELQKSIAAIDDVIKSLIN